MEDATRCRQIATQLLEKTMFTCNLKLSTVPVGEECCASSLQQNIYRNISNHLAYSLKKDLHGDNQLMAGVPAVAVAD
jgi:hypothetical protein